MKKPNGFAIIFVLVFMATITTILANILYQTQIIAKHTMSEEDQLKAQGAALTGLGFSKLLVKFQAMTQSKNAPANLPFALPTSLYASLNNIPIGGKTLNHPLLRKFLDENIVSELLKIPGQFVINVTSENCKLDLNLLQPGTYSISTTFALQNLFSTPDSAALLQIYHLNGETLIQNIINYLQTINRPLATLDELRMIEGFQYDDIYNVYAPYFTIWPIATEVQNPPLNPNCAPIELLASILRPNTSALINPVLWKKFNDYRNDGNTFKAISDFTQWFENNGKTWLNSDVKQVISQYFGFQQNIFMVEVTGTVNQTKQKLIAVFRTRDDGTIETISYQWSQ